MESRFAHDFSHVRVHTDETAAASAAALSASAYTVGRDVVMASGCFAPHTQAGRRLLAHELAHVVQARGAAVSAARVGSPDDRAEREAASAAAAIDGPGMRSSLARGLTAQDPRTLRRQLAPPGRPAPVATFTSLPDDSVALDAFAVDGAKLTAEHQKTIDNFAWGIGLRLDLFPTSFVTSIKVIGHADTTAGEQHNTDLGHRRAESARAALQVALKNLATAKKLPPARLGTIEVSSTGEHDLAIETADEVREPRNRRVVITATMVMPTPVPRPAGAVPPWLGGPQPWLGDPAPKSADKAPGAKPEIKGSPPVSTAKPVQDPIEKANALADEVAKASADTIRRDKLYKELRDFLSGIVPVVPTKDVQRKIDDALAELIKTGSKALLKALLEGLIGKGAATAPPGLPNVGPATPERDLGKSYGLTLPAIPFDSPPPLPPKLSVEYRDGPKSSYPPGGAITFTLVLPANYRTAPGNTRVGIRSADEDAQRIGDPVQLTSDTQKVTMTAPSKPGAYFLRVETGLGFDRDTVKKFEVK